LGLGSAIGTSSSCCLSGEPAFGCEIVPVAGTVVDHGVRLMLLDEFVDFPAAPVAFGAVRTVEPDTVDPAVVRAELLDLTVVVVAYRAPACRAVATRRSASNLRGLNRLASFSYSRRGMFSRYMTHSWRPGNA